MITQKPTPEMLAEWRAVFEANRGKLHPNRKTGEALDRYFCERYAFPLWDAPDFAQIVAANITENPHHAAKLPAGTLPKIRTYRKDGILVGIDLVTGFFHIECEDIGQVIPIHDDLFVYLGLDQADLENPFLVAEYVRLSKNQP